MSLELNATVLSASVDFLGQKFATPMQMSTGAITHITEARASVRVRVGGTEATGRGSIYLSDLWAWPKGPADRALQMRDFCSQIADSLPTLCGGESAHPLELGLRLHSSVAYCSNSLPVLARAVCASPCDAALHDAVGQALGVSAFRFYETDAPIPTADHLFPDGVIPAIRRTLLAPKNCLPAWWILNAHDDLSAAIERATKLGIHRFKVKTLAQNTFDAGRLEEACRLARDHGLSPVFSIDSNEAHADPAAVDDFLNQLTPATREAILYLEQPTSRDLLEQSHNWHALSARKPIILDEGFNFAGSASRGQGPEMAWRGP